MKKIYLTIITYIILFFSVKPVLAQEDKFCTLYFTYIGCPNCARTDPLVLGEWLKKYPNLIVIEYSWLGGDWGDPNSKFFGDYAEKCGLQAAVPQIVIKENENCLGAIDVPRAEDFIKEGKSNSCPLIDKAVPFDKLDLDELPGKPKIWANEKVLVSLGEGDWLFQWNGAKPEILNTPELKAVKPQNILFSGAAFPNATYVPSANFENAVKIRLSDISSVVDLMSADPTSIAQNPDLPSNETDSNENEVKIPLFGKLNTKEFSLPVLTFLLGIADGFNPCAFFILTFLLAALIGLAGARKKIFLVGGIFIFFSVLFYFLFMAVLLNVFKIGEQIMFLTFAAGLVAVFAGIVNIKDYFAFQKGISLTLSKDQKLKFMQKVKNLSLAKSTSALIVATVVIAVTVNTYELLCTVGFPMVFIRILTLRDLPSIQYYFYLIMYSLVYSIPLLVIVFIFAGTLGKKSFSKTWVKRLKLISGLMILFLGSILIIKPKLLESVSTSFLILASAVLIGITVIFIREKSKNIPTE